MFTEANSDIADLAKKTVGGAKQLAILLVSRGHQITPQAISQWRRIPAAKARDVAEVTGIPLHQLRPDLWPEGEEA